MKTRTLLLAFLIIGAPVARAMEERVATIERILHGDYGQVQLVCDTAGYFAKIIYAQRIGWNVSLEGVDQLVCGKFIALSWQTPSGWQTQLIKIKTKRASCLMCCNKHYYPLDNGPERTIEIKRVYPSRPGRCRALARDGTVLTETGTSALTTLHCINIRNEQHIEITISNNHPCRLNGPAGHVGICSELMLCVNNQSQRFTDNIFYLWDTHSGKLLLFIDENHEHSLKLCLELASGKLAASPKYWSPQRLPEE